MSRPCMSSAALDAVNQGPLIEEAALQKVERHVQDALAKEPVFSPAASSRAWAARAHASVLTSMWKSSMSALVTY